MAFLQKPQICQHGPPTTVDFPVKPLEKAKAGKAITTKLSYETQLVQWVLAKCAILDQRKNH